MRSFSRYSSYRKHLVDTHSDCEASSIEPVISCHKNNCRESENDVFELDVDEPVETTEWSIHDEHGLCTSAVMFIAKMRASGSITMESIDLVVQNSSDMTMEILDHLQSYNLSKLKGLAENPEGFEDALLDIRAEFQMQREPF